MLYAQPPTLAATSVVALSADGSTFRAGVSHVEDMIEVCICYNNLALLKARKSLLKAPKSLFEGT